MILSSRRGIYDPTGPQWSGSSRRSGTHVKAEARPTATFDKLHPTVVLTSPLSFAPPLLVQGNALMANLSSQLPAWYDKAIEEFADKEPRDVAHQAIKIFERNDLQSYIFGNLGLNVYDHRISPKSEVIEIAVVTNRHSTDDLKDMLVRGGGGVFFRKPSQKGGATYDVLWCKLSGRSYASKNWPERKVNIVTPGVRYIPALPPASLLTHKAAPGVPIAPFFALLFLKLDCWSSRRRSRSEHFRRLEGEEKRLIDLLVWFGRVERLADSQQWMPPEFLEMGQTLAREFVAVHGKKEAWEPLGIELQDAIPVETNEEIVHQLQLHHAFFQNDI
ncbi:hypothetical protein EIP91_001798 [Steccherinum ochraceum]|uniref:Uncharacterized protein n=1 Tax=Steccherinum ochraceum TaxID=92696 RepID=A0A4V2MXM9_9APHY|nr:hypothetical protein EIP91_001798 [Steccherinum ochraceum]